MLWLKRAGQALLTVIALGAFAYGAVYARVEWQLRRRVARPTLAPIAFTLDSASVARGARLVNVVSGCAGCHGADLGGHAMLDVPLVIRLTSSNLTTGDGGVLSQYDNAALDAAVRHGVAADGRALRFMPSHEFATMADDHLADIIAYLRTRPPINRRPAPIHIGPVARILTVAGKMDLFPYDLIDHAAPHLARAPRGATVEHGEYLANACRGCHGPNLSGGRIPGAPSSIPAARNITPAGIGDWTDADFIRVLRTGKRPDGTSLHPFMPWERIGKMSDDELIALRHYLATVPARPSGTR
jgi:mono/diheme cytochrome c family protein